MADNEPPPPVHEQHSPEHEYGPVQQPEPLSQPGDSVSPDLPHGGVPNANGIDPSNFLQPIQDIGSNAGQLPSQASSALEPLASAAGQPLSMLQGLAPPASALPRGIAPKLPGGGPHPGEDQVHLDPEQAHATTARAEQQATHGIGAKKAPTPLAGKSSFDQSAATVITGHHTIDAGHNSVIAATTTAHAQARRAGTTLIHAADDTAAIQQATIKPQ